jgi:hypothetical protein
MFYTLVQESHTNPSRLIRERFLCFEARSKDEAIARAEWFGIDLEETIDVDWLRWLWYDQSCGTSRPEVAGRNIEMATEFYTGFWMVLYLDGRMRSNRGLEELRQMEVYSDMNPTPSSYINMVIPSIA